MPARPLLPPLDQPSRSSTVSDEAHGAAVHYTEKPFQEFHEGPDLSIGKLRRDETGYFPVRIAAETVNEGYRVPVKMARHPFFISSANYIEMCYPDHLIEISRHGPETRTIYTKIAVVSNEGSTGDPLIW